MIEISSGSEREFSDGCEDQEVEEVTVTGDKWIIRVLYYKLEQKLEFVADMHSTQQIYTFSFTNDSMFKGLQFYGDVKTIYKYLAQNPTKRLRLNQLGPHLLLIDTIANQTRMTQIPLEKKNMDILQLKEIKIRQLQAQNYKLRQEKGRLKYNTDQWSKKQNSLKMKIKNLQEQNSNLADRIKRLEYKAKLWKEEQAILQKRCLMFPESKDKEFQYLQRRIKMRKMNDGRVRERSIVNGENGNNIENRSQAGRKQQQEEVQSQNGRPLNLVPKKQEQYYEMDSEDKQLIEIVPNESIIFEQKLIYTIPIQPNSSHFAVSLPTIKKISSSLQSRIFYFISDQCIKQSLSRASRVFVSFQNLSEEEQIQQEEFNLLVGIISSSCVNFKSAQNCQKIIYLDTGKSKVIRMGISRHLQKTISFKFKDIINFVLDFDEEQIQWYLNNQLITKVALDVEMWEGGIHPFIELKSVNSKIEII